MGLPGPARSVSCGRWYDEPAFSSSSDDEQGLWADLDCGHCCIQQRHSKPHLVGLEDGRVRVWYVGHHRFPSGLAWTEEQRTLMWRCVSRCLAITSIVFRRLAHLLLLEINQPSEEFAARCAPRGRCCTKTDGGPLPHSSCNHPAKDGPADNRFLDCASHAESRCVDALKRR